MPLYHNYNIEDREALWIYKEEKIIHKTKHKEVTQVTIESVQTTDKRKKTILAICAIFLALGIIILGTYAWLQYRTPKVVNTFKLGTGVDLELKEDKFDADSRKFEFTPGMVLDKDPTIHIQDSVQLEEYIAMTVKYYKEEFDSVNNTIKLVEIPYASFISEYTTIQSFQKEGAFISGALGTIETENEAMYTLADGFRSNWVTDDHKVFYYGTGSGVAELTLTKVTSGASVTLFDKVKIKDPYDHLYLKAGSFPIVKTDAHGVDVTQTTRPVSVDQPMGFEIEVCAYAVQGNISSAEGKAALDSLISSSTS